MRFFAPLLILCAGCSSAPTIAFHSEFLGDAEIKAAGKWTAADQRARDLIDSRFDGTGLTVSSGKPMPVRRMSTSQQLSKRVQVGDTILPIPSPSAVGTKAFGLGWQPSYVLRGERNAIILLHENAPATILPMDPAKPIDFPEEVTPGIVWEMMRKDLDRDLEGLRPSKPPPAP